MKPLKWQPGFHETCIMSVLYAYPSPSWHSIHSRIESHIKWQIIDPVAHTLHLALLDIIDKMLIDEISNFEVK